MSNIRAQPKEDTPPVPNHIAKKLVAFSHPFTLASRDETWTAGDYTIATEEEPLKGLTTLAYPRVETTMIFRSGTRTKGGTRFIVIDPQKLDATLIQNRKTAENVEFEDVLRQAKARGVVVDPSGPCLVERIAFAVPDLTGKLKYSPG